MMRGLNLLAAFVIYTAPVSKKNSQRIIVNRRTGRPMVMPSAAYTAYEKRACWELKEAPCEWAWAPQDGPLQISAHFYMPTKRRVDLVNLLEAIDDVLVRAGIIPDDDSRVIASHDGSRVFYDKTTPRTEVYIYQHAEHPDELLYKLP